ncbi:MAG: hypothetical protein AB2A00_17620 [Myxococcota bacterium]
MNAGLQIYNAPPGAAVASCVGQAFSQFRMSNATVAAVVFADNLPPDRTVVDVVVGELQRTPSLGQLYLVHPSPLLGFMTSTICLRVPTVKVRACPSLDQAKSLASGGK